MRDEVAKAEQAKKAAKVNELLTAEYGRKSGSSRDDPVDALVETILSQNTSDVNSHRAFLQLKREYPSWSDVTDASVDELARTIRSGGLAEIKARRIKKALRFILTERGELSIDFLGDMAVSEAEKWLMSMDGVGPKTAAIVLLFSFGLPAFPVDTHIHRVSRRLGLAPPKSSRERVQSELASVVPKDEYYNFHINLIEHGRRVCRSRNPLCGSCVLAHICDHRASDLRAQA